MLLYLPIAELPVNVFAVIGMAAAVGFIGAIFGVGGGFLMTPLLIFSGVPSAVAVATVAPQIAASSLTGTLAAMRRGDIDLRLSRYMVGGGLVGTLLGVVAFQALRRAGQLDLFIALAYIVVLGSVGALMLVESTRALLARRSGGSSAAPTAPGTHRWADRLPFKKTFRKAGITLSILPVMAFGALVAFAGTILGIGGGFILVPMLLYVLRIPTALAIGTSLYQITATMMLATIFHAVANTSVDALLALLLMAGSVVGAQFGARIGRGLRGEAFRLLLGLLVFSVAVRFALSVLLTPAERFSLAVVGGG